MESNAQTEGDIEMNEAIERVSCFLLGFFCCSTFWIGPKVKKLVKKKNARRAGTQSEHKAKYLNHTVTEKREAVK